MGNVKFSKSLALLSGVLLLLGLLPLEAAPPSASWPLLWNDEFNGGSIDSSKWSWGSLPWGGRHHTDDYASYIMPEDSYVQNGSLWLRCRKATGSEFGGYPYSEGFVHTDGKKNYTYGYVEIRARFPTGRGVWPAFWTLSWGWPPEFDIAEYFGSDDRMHMGLAYGSSWQDVQWDSTNLYSGGFANWHTYGLEWGPGYAVWYMDGFARKSIYASYVPTVPMYVILNSGMRWDADSTTPFPNYFEVDYCRLFSLPPVSVNDNTTGSGQNQFNYVGSWGYYASQLGAFFNDNHWSGVANDYFQVIFNGARVDLYGARAPNHGIAAISIDGGTETFVDYYAPSRTDKTLIWCSPSLETGTHTLKVRVTGLKNSSSTGYSIPSDRVDVWSTSTHLNGTVIGMSGSYNNSGNTREKAFDGDLHTFFDAPVENGAWVGLDMGNGVSRRITRVHFCPRSGFAARMTGGKFQGANSANFSDGVDLFTISGPPAEGMMTAQTINNTTAFRYVRYLSPNGGWGNVAEVEFYGVSGAPSDPSPIDGAADVSISVQLNWTAGDGATAHDVYFGTTNPPEYVDTVTETSFSPGLLEGRTHYYWQIVEQTAYGDVAGLVWEFTTFLPGDYNGDGTVDLSDINTFANHWLESGAGPDYDFNNDGIANLSDFSILASYWLFP